MPLNRAQLSRNRAKYGKNPDVKEGLKRVAELDHVCEKHAIGKLTFKSCKLATPDGKITFIDFEEIKANMRASAMVIKVNSLSESNNLVYDIVELERAKQERDLKKKQEELENVKPEIERLKKLSVDVDKIEATEEHKKLLEKMVTEDDAIINDTNGCAEPDDKNCSSEEEPKDTINEPPQADTKDPEDGDITKPTEEDKEKTKDRKKSSRTKEKREKAIKQLNDIMVQKANQKEIGNKHYRNFMKDIKSKFTLSKNEKFKYLEVKAETADMVIDGAKVYEINMPAKTPNMYLLVAGDLQMKSKLMLQIDPNYKSEKVFDEHNEFLERIKAKENAKVKEANADVVDEEFDELDELGLSDEETNKQAPENNNMKEFTGTDDIKARQIGDNSNDTKINELLNPELLKMKETTTN